MDTPLFNHSEFRKLAEDRLHTMRRTAAGLVEADLEDENEAVERLKRIGEFAVPELNRPAAKLRVDENDGTVRAHVRIPFSGDPGLFSARASQYTLSPPHGRVDYRDGGSLILTDDFPRSATQEQIKKRFAERVDHVEKYLGYLRSDAGLHYSQVSARAQQLVQQRKTELAQFRDLEGGLEDGI